jgi:hypothetical protein
MDFDWWGGEALSDGATAATKAACEGAFTEVPFALVWGGWNYNLAITIPPNACPQ